jgi:hypothetical protein
MFHRVNSAVNFVKDICGVALGDAFELEGIEYCKDENSHDRQNRPEGCPTPLVSSI